MKKFIVGLSIITMTQNTMAFDFNFEESIKYILPCAAGYLVAGALAKDNAAAIGSAVCAGSVAVTYNFSNNRMLEEINYKMSSEHEKMWRQIKLNDERNKKELAIFRDTIRRIVAEKVVEIQTKVDEKALKFLERKDIKDRISKIVMKMAQERAGSAINSLDPKIKKQREKIIEEITNEVIKKIVNKKYAESSPELTNKSESQEDVPITEDSFAKE